MTDEKVYANDRTQPVTPNPYHDLNHIKGRMAFLCERLAIVTSEDHPPTSDVIAQWNQLEALVNAALEHVLCVDDLSMDYEEVSDKLRRTRRKLKKSRGKLAASVENAARLELEKDASDQRLAAARLELERSQANNDRLCALVADLFNRYVPRGWSYGEPGEGESVDPWQIDLAHVGFDALTWDDDADAETIRQPASDQADQLMAWRKSIVDLAREYRRRNAISVKVVSGNVAEPAELEVVGQNVWLMDEAALEARAAATGMSRLYGEDLDMWRVRLALHHALVLGEHNGSIRAEFEALGGTWAESWRELYNAAVEDLETVSKERDELQDYIDTTPEEWRKRYETLLEDLECLTSEDGTVACEPDEAAVMKKLRQCLVQETSAAEMLREITEMVEGYAVTWCIDLVNVENNEVDAARMVLEAGFSGREDAEHYAQAYWDEKADMISRVRNVTRTLGEAARYLGTVWPSYRQSLKDLEELAAVFRQGTARQHLPGAVKARLMEAVKNSPYTVSDEQGARAAHCIAMMLDTAHQRQLQRMIQHIERADSWRGAKPASLIADLENAVKMLRALIELDAPDKHATVTKCADVANFAAMIADVCTIEDEA